MPRAWVILIGLIITPALYSWANIAAFWDPYDATEHITVAVVNEDAGADNELTGHVDVGRQVVDKLSTNTQLGWQFMDAAAAEKALNKGDVYASVTIPRDFSEDLLSMLTGTFTKPELVYRVNEKKNAIAVKITDTGASGIEKQITAAFKEQIAETAAETIKDKGTEFAGKMTDAVDSASTTFGETAQNLQNARDNLDGVEDKLRAAQGSMTQAKSTVADVSTALGDAQDSLSQIQSVIADAQGGLGDFTDAATGAFVEGSTALADSSAQAHDSVADITAGLHQAGARFNAATRQVNDVVGASDEAIAGLSALLASPALGNDAAAPLTQALEELKAGNDSNKQLLTNLQQLAQDMSAAEGDVQASANAVDRAAQDTKATAQTLRDTVAQNLPAINQSMATLSQAAATMTATLESQKGMLGQMDGLIDGIGKQLTATADALGGFDVDLASLQEGLQNVRGDLLALTASENNEAIKTVTGLQADKIGEFFAEPVELKSETIYLVNSYGSAMAAMFTNLSLWIGGFVLMVIFRVEVDKEGFRRVTVAHAYLGRFLLMAVMVLVQALVVSVGNLVIGVQSVNPLAFVGTSMLISLAYLSIIYALSTSLGHLGRGLCVVLAIIQIPGASGIYPIELMPSFFRAIYPLLPFTYGINAMRETISGFYGLHYLQYMGVLAFMFVFSFIVGYLLRRGLAHFNLLFNRELEGTELFDFERVQVVGSGYRIADIIQALDSRGGLQEDLDRRQHDYKRWIRWTAIIGFIGMAILAVVATLVSSQKPLLLGLWTVWGLAGIGLVVTFEYVRKSLIQSAELVDMDDEAIKHPAVAMGFMVDNPEEAE